MEKTIRIEKKTMTATAKVGNDIIEDVEYLMFDRFEFSPETSETKEFKTKVEDFWFTVTLPFRKIKWWIKDMFWEVQYGFERMFKGYDSVDTFEVYSKFINRYYKILEKFKNGSRGYPYGMTEEEWQSIVDKMLYHLYYMEEKNIEEELMKDISDGWMPDGKIVYGIMNKHKDEFFKLFSKHFFDLWD